MLRISSKAILIIMLSGLLMTARAQEDVMPPIQNPELAAIEPEVIDALNIAYASAYWNTAQQLYRYDAPELKEQFWAKADTHLQQLTNPDGDVAEVRRILKYERDNPTKILGWLDRDNDRHSKWFLQAGYFQPADALNPQYFGYSRRTCRMVSAIILDRSASLLKNMEAEANAETYWDLSISVAALRDASEACPDPFGSTNKLLLDIAKLTHQVRRVISEFDENYFPPRRPVVETYPELSVLYATLSGPAEEPPIMSGVEFASASEKIADQAIRVWNAGPDNTLLQMWNRTYKTIQRWRD